MLKIEHLEEEIPVYDITVKDNHNFYANGVLVHNCSEIVLASRPSELLSEELITKEDGHTEIQKRYTAGEIALCNLSSINLEKWLYMTDEERTHLASVTVRTLDNTIDIANYPVKEGKYSNMKYRYLGIGVMNTANFLALQKATIDSQEALEIQDELWEDLSYKIISASIDLSVEKGKFPAFYETGWSNGEMPITKANKLAFDLTKFKHNSKKWEDLADRIQKFGIRNAQLFAIAPTATSAKAINATESIEPVHEYLYKEEGTQNLPTIAANFRKNAKFYKKAFETDQIMLIKAAAVRQKWIDQSQSVNVYIKKPDSLMELTNLHFIGFKLGMKTFYYLKQLKADSEEVCESCT